jgi:peptidylprolyl isomerase
MLQVHFDCIYRSITAVSSRESKILAGNRTIAQVFPSLHYHYDLW